MREIALLVKKDALALYSLMKIYVLLFGGLGVVLAFAGAASGMAFFPVIIVYLVCYGLASYEERYQSSTLAFTLPVRFENTVAARYILAVGSGAAFYLLCMASNLVSMLLFHERSHTILVLTFYLAFGTLLCDIMLPLIYYFGVNKARLTVFIIYLASFLLGGVVMNSQLVRQIGPSYLPSPWTVSPVTVVLLTAGLAALTWGSYRVSAAVAYRRRGV